MAAAAVAAAAEQPRRQDELPFQSPATRIVWVRREEAQVAAFLLVLVEEDAGDTFDMARKQDAVAANWHILGGGGKIPMTQSTQFDTDDASPGVDATGLAGLRALEVVVLQRWQ